MTYQWKFISFEKTKPKNTEKSGVSRVVFLAILQKLFSDKKIDLFRKLIFKTQIDFKQMGPS
jgi:hypothetical protein